MAISRIGACALGQIGRPGGSALLIIPSRGGERWFGAASREDMLQLVAKACDGAPDYARPKAVFVCMREEAARAKLFTANGRIRRAAALALLADKASLSEPTQPLR